ncbi:hypothetical protein AMTR_s00180p00044420 [Amborella trichopoda]|uniref:Uncharacterized protein n=1 Tax=Amborella trichopoda TaxID=13333 RepID=W1PX92_AMBTC|nr:hypothetical protein AMTR_s00180p00044420 [Amborella trichopoda]
MVFGLHLSNIEKEKGDKGQQFNKAKMGAIAMTSTQLDDSSLIPNLALKTAISNLCDEWGSKKPSIPPN